MSCPRVRAPRVIDAVVENGVEMMLEEVDT